MRKQMSMQEATDMIYEICNCYDVPLSQSRQNIPEGRQGSDDIISIIYQLHFNPDELGYFVQYSPWVRSMTTLTTQEFEELLIHGKKVLDCVNELNDFLNGIVIVEE